MLSARMSITKAALTVSGCSIAFALIGGVMGFLLGKIAPGYYRGVFSGGDSPTFDPLQVGLGLGASQGIIGGAVIGLILIFLVPIREGGTWNLPVLTEQMPRADRFVRKASEPLTRGEIVRIRFGAFVGVILGIPILMIAPGYLWELYHWLKPGPPGPLEESMASMSVPGVLLMGLLFGPHLGAGVGAAVVARRLGRPEVVGRWCISCGSVTAVAVTVFCFWAGDPVEMIGMAMLPWRAGHLLWALLLVGWGLRALPSQASLI